MVPILYPLAHFFGAEGIASVQAAADILTLMLAIPIIIKMIKKLNQAEKAHLAESTSL